MQINQWIADAGGDITVNYLIKDAKVNRTNADETNPMWTVLQNTARELYLSLPEYSEDMIELLKQSYLTTFITNPKQ